MEWERAFEKTLYPGFGMAFSIAGVTLTARFIWSSSLASGGGGIDQRYLVPGTNSGELLAAMLIGMVSLLIVAFGSYRRALTEP